MVSMYFIKLLQFGHDGYDRLKEVNFKLEKKLNRCTAASVARPLYLVDLSQAVR